MTREPIYAALFAFFSGLQGGALFKLATRKTATWENIAPEDQPALLMMPRRERSEKRKGFPAKWTLSVDLFLYVNTSALMDPEAIPAQILNPLLDAIESALEVDDITNDACTLGGLVSHCAIDGEIQIFPGDLGSEAVAIVPISILTTA